MAALTTESCNTLALAIKDVLDFMNVHEAASQNASPRAPAPERQMGAPREAAGFSKRAVPAMTPAEIAQPPPADFLSPRTDPPAKRAKLVGYDNFVRHNPHSDRFEVKRFHHLEITCGDAKSTAAVLCTALSVEYQKDEPPKKSANGARSHANIIAVWRHLSLVQCFL